MVNDNSCTVGSDDIRGRMDSLRIKKAEALRSSSSGGADVC